EESREGQGGHASDIFGRRYDSAGAPLAGEFQVNTYTTGTQSSQAIAVDPAGNFVVVWEGVDQSYAGVFGRRFDNAGLPLGSEFQVNTYTMVDQWFPAIAVD